MEGDRKFSREAIRFDFDLVERIVVTLILGIFASRMVPAVLANASYVNVLLLISETIVVLFVIFRRRASAISLRISDWAIGFASTLAPLLAIPAQGKPLIPTAYCAVLLLGGFFLQMAAKLTLRRSFGVVAANRGIKMSGPYAFIRHPMYAGYVLTHIAFLLAGPNLWNLSVYSVALGLFVVRILAEERLLSQDETYLSFSARVRYRLFPFVF